MQTYATNRKALRNYEVLDKVEAGIALTGAEVKSVRHSQVNLKEGYVMFFKEEAWLESISISKWKTSSESGYNPTRSRKLLLNKKEILKLQSKSSQKGITLIPLKVYNKKGRIKVELALARGKRIFEHDKNKKKVKARREALRAVKQGLREM